jgi:hypothetical protein
MKRPFQWPSRERWAEMQQRPYWSEGERCPYDDNYSHQLSDYATPEEIVTLIARLKKRYRELGREMKTVKPHASIRAKGETSAAWYYQLRTLPQAVQEATNKLHALQRERSDINDLLKRIHDYAIPDRTRHSDYVPGKAGELVAPFVARYGAAFKAARDAYFKEYAAKAQIDDAAWEKELQRRTAIEQQYQS